MASTSIFSFHFERFLKEWIVHDVWEEIDSSQYCTMKGTGMEHMLMKLVDRVRNLLDKNPNKSSVIAVAVDWVSAFD